MRVVDLARRAGFEIRLAGQFRRGHQPTVRHHAQSQINLVAADLVFQPMAEPFDELRAGLLVAWPIV